MSAIETGSSRPVIFSTRTPYALPSQKFMIPVTWKRYQLSQLINKALTLLQPIPFDFLIRNEILRTSLQEWCAERGVGEEETLEIEYFESVMPPQHMSSLPHENWVSAVSCQMMGHFITASYDGHVRVFNYSQNMISDVSTHAAPATSLCIVPTRNLTPDARFIASASHDLTAKLIQTSSSPESGTSFEILASLHLHTAPLTSIASDASGSHLLTTSSDGLLGLWDTKIPAEDEVPLDDVDSAERRKRRKIAQDEDRPKRKAPVSVLKSHTARVSKAVFAQNSPKTAYSCGFDSTIRTWDVEIGVCTNTMNIPEKPMLDLILSSDDQTAIAASTDRTVCLYDLRSSSGSTTTSNIGGLAHTATPSCLVYSPFSGSYQIASGAYDGVARIWDLRSTKSAVTSFKVWNGDKILGIDWTNDVMAVGGEGGVDIWRVGEGERTLPS